MSRIAAPLLLAPLFLLACAKPATKPASLLDTGTGGDDTYGQNGTGTGTTTASSSGAGGSNASGTGGAPSAGSSTVGATSTVGASGTTSSTGVASTGSGGPSCDNVFA